jgi:beta-lactam-binding protein with PASTA domain
VAVLLLLLFALVGFSSASGTSSLETGAAKAIPATRVPTVIGLESPYAMRRVRRAGLVPAQTWCRTTATIWAVKSQRPTGGTTVPRGTRVTLRLVPAQSQGVRHTPCNAYRGPLP